MKVKVTATISMEMDLYPEDYSDMENPPKTDDEILAWERQLAKDEPYDSGILELLASDGDWSNVKIEKVEEKVEAA